MKKLSIAFILLSFRLNAQADVSVGLKLTAAQMKADGRETQNLVLSLIKKKEKQTWDWIIICRKAMDVGGFDLSLGLNNPSYCRGCSNWWWNWFWRNCRGWKFSCRHVQPVFNGDTSLYVKAGYAQADLEITNISRQQLFATGELVSTDGPMTKSLEGPMYGIGVQVAMDNFVDSIRVELTRHDFDEISHINSNSKTLKADAAMDSLSSGLVKSF